MATAIAGQTILVTGPARSGKSEWAEHLARQSQQAVVYVATAQRDPTDPEWQARLDRHQQRRPDHWQTLEVPVHLAAVLATATADQCWLVDSLGTWLANSLDQSEAAWAQQVQALQRAIAPFPGTLILVAEETGWGVVPAYPLGRTFRDRLGTLTRCLGPTMDATYLVTAGYALNLRTVGIPLPTDAVF